MVLGMKDSMNMLFSERFHGHEMPVDPVVWQGIQQQMGHASTAGADGVSKLFKDRFQAHETAVDPAVWQAISAQLGHTVVGTTAGSGFLGWAAAGVVAVTIGTVAYFTMSEPRTTTVATLPGVPAAQVTTTTVPDAPLALVVNTTKEAASTGPTAAFPEGPERKVPDRIEQGAGTADVEIDPVPSTSSNPAEQPPLPTKEGAAVVESIIAGITTEVKQQVLEQQVQGDGTGTATTPPAEDEPEIVADEAPMPKLFVPNTFTPNGDGKNDEYQIGSEGFDQVLIRVYSVKDNRLVFSSTNSQEKWLGTNCEDGMYLVAVEARTPDGRTTTEGKVVWLNRNQMN